MVRYKRGNWGARVAVTLILALVIGALLFLGTERTAYALDRGGKLEACRTSVLLASKARIPITGTQLTSLTCSVQKLSFDNVKLGDIDKVNEDIARAVNDCISVSFDGSVSLKGDYEGGCIVCAIISFDQKSKLTYDGATFVDWIKRNNIGSSNLTYFNYYDGFNDKVDKTILGLRNTPGKQWSGTNLRVSIPGTNIIDYNKYKDKYSSLQSSDPKLIIDPDIKSIIDPNDEPLVIYYRTGHLVFSSSADISADNAETAIILKSFNNMVKECSKGILNIKGISIEGKSEKEIKKSLGLENVA